MCGPFYCLRSSSGKLVNCLALHASSASIGHGKYFRKSYSECAVTKILSACFSPCKFLLLNYGLIFWITKDSKSQGFNTESWHGVLRFSPVDRLFFPQVPFLLCSCLSLSYRTAICSAHFFFCSTSSFVLFFCHLIPCAILFMQSLNKIISFFPILCFYMPDFHFCSYFLFHFYIIFSCRKQHFSKAYTSSAAVNAYRQIISTEFFSYRDLQDYWQKGPLEVISPSLLLWTPEQPDHLQRWSFCSVSRRDDHTVSSSPRKTDFPNVQPEACRLQFCGYESLVCCHYWGSTSL